MLACLADGTLQPDPEEPSSCQWFRIHSAREPVSRSPKAGAENDADVLPESSGTPLGSARSVVTQDGSTAGGSLVVEGCLQRHELLVPPCLCNLEQTASLSTSDTTAADIEGSEVGASEQGIDRVRLAWHKRVSLVDRKQAELFDAQWHFLRDQVSSFSNEIVSMRDELRCLLERAVQVEVRDRINAWRQGSDGSLDTVGEPKHQTVPTANSDVDLHRLLTELRVALDAEVLQRKDGETKTMGRFQDCLQIAKEAVSGQAILSEQFELLRTDLRSIVTTEAGRRSDKEQNLEQQIRSLRDSSAQESLRCRDEHNMTKDTLQKLQCMAARFGDDTADETQCVSSRNSTVLENEVRTLRDEIAQKEQGLTAASAETLELAPHRAGDGHDVSGLLGRWDEVADDGALQQTLQGLFASVGALQEAVGREAELRANATQELRQALRSEIGSVRAYAVTQWETELQRMWDAIETHTHDVRMDVPETLESHTHKAPAPRMHVKHQRGADAHSAKKVLQVSPFSFGN